LDEEEHQRAVRELLAGLGGCGCGVGIYGRFVITGRDKMTVGNNVHIGGNAFIRAEGGLTIGDNVHISRNLVLYTINHRYEGERIPYDETFLHKPVEIGRNAWIGMNVCIAPGSVIGEGAIVAMGTVVSGHVPPMAVVGSQKWRVLKHRDPERYSRLDEVQAYGGINGLPLDLEEP
jgi:maltose O-acetyltransferase